MSSESSPRRRARASENIGTNVPRNFAGRNYSKFGIVVVALWPHKPALCLAQVAGISERGAQFIIDGKRKPNARVVHAFTGALLDE